MPIFDQGYQHWSGKLTGHGWRWLAIARHGIRTGLKAKRVRYVLFIAWSPALALAAFLCAWGLLERKSPMVSSMIQIMSILNGRVVAEPLHYRADVWRLAYSIFFATELWFSMILILLVGPSLISQDLRFNALPLYFSRPLRRADYFFGKLAVIGGFLSMVVIAPAIVAYILGLLFSLDLTIIPDTIGILLGGIAYGAIIVLSGGLLILALSSLSRNSRNVALMWLGVWFVTSVMSSVLTTSEYQQQTRAFFFHGAPSRRVQFGPGGGGGRRRMQLERDPAYNRFEESLLLASQKDWRPMVSYTQNLSRLGHALLGTDTAWQSLSELEDPSTRAWFLMRYQGPQYPWYWSAGVLAGLMALSACTLNIPVKSMDRLK